jgi:hypothetical protein
MLDEILKWLEAAAGYLPLVSVIVGTLSGWIVSLVVEAFFLPLYWPKRTQQGVTVVLNIAASGLGASLMWWALDGGTSFSHIAAVSFVVSPLAAVLYPIVGRWATARWPIVASAWMH